MVHNILFDPPILEGQRINIDNGRLIINNLDSIYNKSWFRNLFRCYFIFLLIQYILIYACVPLDEIENRPSISIVANFFTLIMFIICISLLPLCSSTIPTICSLRCLFISLCLLLMNLILDIVSLVQCLKIDEMYQIEKNETGIKIRVENYIILFNLLELIFTFFSCVSCLSLIVICERSLEYISGKVDRRSLKNPIEMISMESMNRFNKNLDNYYSI